MLPGGGNGQGLLLHGMVGKQNESGKGETQQEDGVDVGSLSVGEDGENGHETEAQGGEEDECYTFIV
jgi:hypothetical protein